MSGSLVLVRTTLRGVCATALALAVTLGAHVARADLAPGPSPDPGVPAPRPPEDRRGCGSPAHLAAGLALLGAALLARAASRARNANCATAQAPPAP